MNEAIIFVVGSVMFIVTAWATIAFLLTRAMALEERPAKESVDAH